MIIFNIQEQAVKAGGQSLSERARQFDFKSPQLVASWIINQQVISKCLLNES